jgi:hypothetical protein
MRLDDVACQRLQSLPSLERPEKIGTLADACDPILQPHCAARATSRRWRTKRCLSRDLAADSRDIAEVDPQKNCANTIFGVEAVLSLLYFPAPRRWV